MVDYNDKESLKIWQRILQKHEREVLFISVPTALFIGLIAIIAILFL